MVTKGDQTRNAILDRAVSISSRIGLEALTICTLAEAAAWPVQSHVRVFRDEFQRHIDEGACPFGETFPDYLGVNDLNRGDA